MLGGARHYEVDEDNPRPLGRCDRCCWIWNLDRLRMQQEWRGMALMDTGLMVCPRCLDQPNPSLRTIILKPDPEPVENARPGTPIPP